MKYKEEYLYWYTRYSQNIIQDHLLKPKEKLDNCKQNSGYNFT